MLTEPLTIYLWKKSSRIFIEDDALTPDAEYLQDFLKKNYPQVYNPIIGCYMGYDDMIQYGEGTLYKYTYYGIITLHTYRGACEVRSFEGED